MKLTKHTNYRVEALVDDWRGTASHHQLTAACEDLLAQIKRHCDGYERLDVNWDTEETCSHCKSEWEPDWDRRGPECCEAAHTEWAMENLEAGKR